MTFNCMIAGVGGQGTVLASKLIAAAAIKNGYDVRTTETIGMAQRGGSVVSHVRIGENIFSPFIPQGKAHILVAFEPAEAVRHLSFLSGQGLLIVCDNAIKPVAGGSTVDVYEVSAMIDYLKTNVQKLVVIDGQRIIEHSAKTLNVALLGAAMQSGIFPFYAETINDIILEMLPQHFHEINFKSYELGRKLFP